MDGLGRIRIYTDANNFTDLEGGNKIGDSLWESEDGKFTYTLGDDGEGSFTLNVTHVDGGGVVVHGFNPGELGINPGLAVVNKIMNKNKEFMSISGASPC